MILITLIIVISLSICVGLVKLGVLYWTAYRVLLRSKCFGGPKALPFIGNAHLFMGDISGMYNKLQELMVSYETPFRLWFGPRLYFALQDPEHIKLVLHNPNALGKDEAYSLIKVLTGEGLLIAPVPKWKLHRKLIQPFFIRDNLQLFLQIFERNALLVAEEIERVERGKEFDICNYVLRYAFESSIETAVGDSLDSFGHTASSLVKAINSVLSYIPVRLVTPWLYFDIIFNCTSAGQAFSKNIEFIHKFGMNVLNFMRIKREKGIEQRKSLLTQLVNLSDQNYKLSDKEIFDELLTMIGGAYESSSTLLSMALFALAKHPDVQDKVYAEVRDILAESKSKGSAITLQDLHRMEYLDRVIKETLRLFPVVPLMLRTLEEDINLDKCVLPAGCSVMINLLTVHRNEKHWPMPLEFNPDRFLPMHPLGPQPPQAYIPFSSGLRNCIGAKYAIASSKAFLATFISRYIVKTSMPEKPAELQMTMSIFLKSKKPILLSMEKRFPET